MTQLSKYFTLHEATYLPKLGINYVPTIIEMTNIKATAEKMDEVRELLDAPIKVHIWIRPIKIQYNGPDKIIRNKKGEEVKINTGDVVDYNELVGGSKYSAHITGQAVDFSCSKYTIDQILDILQPKCESLSIALENNGTVDRILANGGSADKARNWIHLQTRPLTKEPIYRIFNP